MKVGRHEIDKASTKRSIVRALPHGWKLVRINWKKGGKLKVADTHGRVVHIPLTR